MTINALVIINEWPTLDKDFMQHVVGGPAHFVIVANDYPAYAEGQLRSTLHKEVQDRLLSEVGKTLTRASITDIQKALD